MNRYCQSKEIRSQTDCILMGLEIIEMKIYIDEILKEICHRLLFSEYIGIIIIHLIALNYFLN